MDSDSRVVHQPAGLPAGLVMDQHATTLDEVATATFSPDRRYRYALTRRWDEFRPVVTFLMLNPSTADAFDVDPTVRRCLSFARAWAAGGLLVLNLFALRSTDPGLLRADPDPVGPDNDAVIAERIAQAGDPPGPVVCAWGVHGRLHGRDRQVLDLLVAHGVQPICLGTTRGGRPRHPLYVPNGTPTQNLMVS